MPLPTEPIDFSRLIQRENSNFVGRDWVLQKIVHWIENRERKSRYFLITGKPGTGKTALSARLASLSSRNDAPDGPLAAGFLTAVHFCSARETLWNSPTWFSKSIAKQLALRYPAYLDLIDFSARKELNIGVEQTVTDGHAIGIGSLTLNLGQPSVNELFSQICRAPLGELAKLHPDHQFVILVDGIDESMNHDGSATILSLVANSSQLPENVIFIVTSRNNTNVELILYGAQVDLSMKENEEYSKDDIAMYIEKSLSSIDAKSQPIASWKRELANQGNFLFAHLAIRMFLTIGFGGSPAALPDGLSALMSEWLHRILRSTGRDWATDYAPLFGALSVAQEGLSETELKSFSGQDGSRLRNNLSHLREFLEIGHGIDTKYSLYHNSLREFFFLDMIKLNMSILLNTFYLVETEQHERITNTYRGAASNWKSPDWARLDDYGYHHLSFHLSSLANLPTYSEAVFQFVSPQLLVTKRRRFGSDDSFVSDVLNAIRAARVQEPVNYQEWFRGAVILGCLRGSVAHLPSAAVAAIAIAGEVSLARSVANLRGNAFDYLLMAETFSKGGHKELAQEFFELAMDLQSNIAMGSLSRRRLLDLVYALGAPDQWRSIFKQIVSKNRFLGAIPADVFQELADFCVQIDDMTEIDEVVRSIPLDLMFQGVDVGEFKRFMVKKFQAICIAQVAEAWWRVGRSQDALDMVDQCLEIEASTGRIIDEVRVISALILFKLNKPVRARRLVESLRPKFRAEYQARRRAESGSPKSSFEEARNSGDDEKFGTAVSLALAQRMFELAMREAKVWKQGVARDDAFETIAIAAARDNRWDDTVRALEEIRIVTDEEIWHTIAKELGDAPAADVEKIVSALDAAAARNGAPAIAAQIQGVCAFGLARHGFLREAASRLTKLIKKTQERFGKQPVYSALAKIAILLDDNGCLEGGKIAEELMKTSELSSDVEARRYVGDTVGKTFELMRAQFREHPETAAAMRAGMEKFDKMFEDATAGIFRFKGDAASEVDVGATETTPRRVPAEAFVQTLEAETNQLGRQEILMDGGADAVLALGPNAVLDAAFRAAVGPFLHFMLGKIADQLVNREEFGAALGFMAAHLQQPGILFGSSRFFSQLDDYVPLMWKASGSTLLCRLSDALIEFGIRIEEPSVLAVRD